MHFQQDISYDVVAIRNIKYSRGEKMIAKERKLFSLLTSNSGGEGGGGFSCNFYTFSTAKVIFGDKGKYEPGDAF